MTDRTPTGGLPERLTEALTTERWGSKHDLGEHGRGHRFYAPCGICQGDVGAIVRLVMHVIEAEILAVQVDATRRADELAARLQEAERQRDEALAAVQRVRDLHVRNVHTGDCEHCSERDYPDYAVPWPCPTIAALDQPKGT